MTALRLPLAALLVLAPACIMGAHYTGYAPRDDLVFEKGQDHAVRRVAELLELAAKPDVAVGSPEVTDEWMFFQASRGPLGNVPHKASWDEIAAVKVASYTDPGVPESDWIYDVRLDGADGGELLTLRFTKQAQAHEFADLVWSLRRAAVGE